MSTKTLAPDVGRTISSMLETAHWRTQLGDFLHDIPVPTPLYDDRQFNPLGFAWGWRKLVEEDVLQAAREIEVADTYTLSDLREEDVLPLLAHEEQWVRNIGLAALGRVGQ